MQKLVLIIGGVILVVGLCGCTKSKKEEPARSLGLRGVPASAQMLRDSRGNMSMTAPSLGRVYVYDADDDMVAWAGALEKGQRFVVVPDDNRISVGSELLAYHRILVPTHRHQIYFEEPGK